MAACDIFQSAVAYLCKKLYIGSRKKRSNLSAYCSSPWYVCMWPRTMLYICEIYMIAIWCNILVYDYNIHIRVAIYKRYVEYGYTQNMNGNMSNMLRYLQYVRYVRYAPGVRYRPPIHGKSAWIQAVVVASSSIWQSTVIPWRRSRPTRLSAFVRFQRSGSQSAYKAKPSII